MMGNTHVLRVLHVLHTSLHQEGARAGVHTPNPQPLPSYLVGAYDHHRHLVACCDP